MEKSFKITLADGTQLKNLKLNGNNYISKTEITEDDFKGKLSKITITLALHKMVTNERFI